MQYGGVIEFKICIKEEPTVHTVAVNLSIRKKVTVVNTEISCYKL